MLNTFALLASTSSSSDDEDPEIKSSHANKASTDVNTGEIGHLIDPPQYEESDPPTKNKESTTTFLLSHSPISNSNCDGMYSISVGKEQMKQCFESDRNLRYMSLRATHVGRCSMYRRSKCHVCGYKGHLPSQCPLIVS